VAEHWTWRKITRNLTVVRNKCLLPLRDLDRSTSVRTC
jgi:hypothetical protein